MKKISIIHILFLIIIPFAQLSSTGKVYLVLGSDTAIWDGLGVSKYNCTLNLSLYTDPSRNCFTVMDPSWRSQFIDSYGNPLKMTWWMMAGAQFRYATNTNIPVPNIMTLYLMQKYHGKNVEINGDELSLHYHTWKWTDYDKDGVWWWNQTKDFLECKEDFDFTLAQFLIEEEVFPISFRSGWHYMDNNWQHYLNDLLPFSMHNDYPHVRLSDTEPIDNIYDWSISPSEWVPFHPAQDDYRVPGDTPGWNVRSAHFSTTRVNDYLYDIFKAADEGIDQVACIWGHLPETDFLENIAAIDSLAHRAEGMYDGVIFRYCTAVEAMRLWMGSEDVIAPQLTITEELSGDSLYLQIQSSEPIFQKTPFIAVKDIYENYYVVPCIETGSLTWHTSKPLEKGMLAKIGFTVCDSVGNQNQEYITYRPDDLYIDNDDPGYMELSGNWSSNQTAAWGTSSRIANIEAGDTISAKWILSVEKTGLYNVFIQIPYVDNAVEQLDFTFFTNAMPVCTTGITSGLRPNEWNYLNSINLNPGEENYILMEVAGDNQTGKQAVSDVLKISSLIRPRDLVLRTRLLNFTEVSQYDTVSKIISVFNGGIEALTINGYFETCNGNIEIINDADETINVPPMSEIGIPVRFYFPTKGTFKDTMLIRSDDPLEPVVKIELIARVEDYFEIVDNEDSGFYEEFGAWHYSNAQAYGPTSRYAYLNQNPPAEAKFWIKVQKDGLYEISEIVPTTVNSADKALYIISVEGLVLDSIITDQNEGSGLWKPLGRYNILKDQAVKIRVVDTHQSTVGPVLRADAIKVAWVDEVQATEITDHAFPLKFALESNFPNPFNNQTTIRYSVASPTQVELIIYDILGKEVEHLVNEYQNSGKYSVQWNSNTMCSGLFIYVLKTDFKTFSKKMILMK
ncbi:MAG: T9SS type A sorting domain-containing protein [Candidatus Marinimicrobia bacterium]|nr:T9SS type A sorting domain-containing protein [Candidatus Neomarinimicrobiota bacterium]